MVEKYSLSYWKLFYIYLIENRERINSSTVNTSTQQENTDKTTKGK